MSDEKVDVDTVAASSDSATESQVNSTPTMDIDSSIVPGGSDSEQDQSAPSPVGTFEPQMPTQMTSLPEPDQRPSHQATKASRGSALKEPQGSVALSAFEERIQNGRRNVPNVTRPPEEQPEPSTFAEILQRISDASEREVLEDLLEFREEFPVRKKFPVREDYPDLNSKPAALRKPTRQLQPRKNPSPALLEAGISPNGLQDREAWAGLPSLGDSSEPLRLTERAARKMQVISQKSASAQLAQISSIVPESALGEFQSVLYMMASIASVLLPVGRTPVVEYLRFPDLKPAKFSCVDSRFSREDAGKAMAALQSGLGAAEEVHVTIVEGRSGKPCGIRVRFEEEQRQRDGAHNEFLVYPD
mmetsp:Transcript_21233/g.56743  ORF Transcript_21233/g.56743 Transcript_21233/m.56743 type:complete len:360 (-) Transcript_21233:298-1377(-)